MLRELVRATRLALVPASSMMGQLFGESQQDKESKAQSVRR